MTTLLSILGGLAAGFFCVLVVLPLVGLLLSGVSPLRILRQFREDAQKAHEGKKFQ